MCRFRADLAEQNSTRSTALFLAIRLPAGRRYGQGQGCVHLMDRPFPATICPRPICAAPSPSLSAGLTGGAQP